MKLLLFLLLPCLALSEVGKDFSKCSRFFLNNGPPQFTPLLNPTAKPLLEVSSTKPICQCLKNDDGQQMYLYATLYNTAWRIPVYSAYKFGSANTGRCDAWYIEPQLDGVAEPCMAPKGRNTAIGVNQALNRDYEDSGYDRGHLYPVQHTDNPISMLATSTLTNAAPQDPDFNQGAWKNHEKDVINLLKKCKKAYVVTGVVPHPIENINNRVTVSKYYWRATCCQDNNDKFKGQGYYGPNDKGEVEPLSITDLQKALVYEYGLKKVVIFPGVPISLKYEITDCN